jgi:hypothetical protein
MRDRSIVGQGTSTKGYPLMAQTPKTPAAPRKAGPARVTGPAASKAAAAAATGPDAVTKPAAKTSAPKASPSKALTPKAPAAKAPEAKPRARPAPKAKPAPEAQVAAAASALVSAVGETIALRKKDLVDRVVAASGAKKKQVKDIVAHTLKVLADAIGRGEQLNLPPFRPAKTAGDAVAPAKPAKASRKAAKPLAVPEKGR